MLHHSKKCSSIMSEADLVKLDKAIKKFHAKFMSTLAELMPSKGNTIKYHKLSHLIEQIRRLGNLKHTDGNFFEADHTRWVHYLFCVR